MAYQLPSLRSAAPWCEEDPRLAGLEALPIVGFFVGRRKQVLGTDSPVPEPTSQPAADQRGFSRIKTLSKKTSSARFCLNPWKSALIRGCLSCLTFSSTLQPAVLESLFCSSSSIS